MESKERYLGIDLLRVISMMGVLVLHFNSSGILSSVSVRSSQYWVAWPFCDSCVKFCQFPCYDLWILFV